MREKSRVGRKNREQEKGSRVGDRLDNWKSRFRTRREAREVERTGKENLEDGEGIEDGAIDPAQGDG